ncbi:MAG: transglycosylase SLT domain-containing protein [Gemmatimonas sp.]|nr:transglycosylase SLT domain-containing protein [Gemmatimonas sp.]
MTDTQGNRSPIRIGRSQAATLAIAGVLGAGWVGGTVAGMARYDSTTGVSPFTAVNIEAAELASSEWDLPNLDHERVDYWVEQFTTEKREDFTNFLHRSGRYVPMISAKLEERGMPQDLVYLAMIESGFNASAYSRADASGLWQFIEETGRRYGLEINSAIDERNDPVKSTDAALDYLTYLHDRFDSWYLAAAAYNTGENRVARIMREETGSERGDEESYYQIWDQLPKETRDYVPLMIAAARISKEPEMYGFGDVEIEPALSYEEVVVDPATPLGAVAQAAGTTLDAIQDLNPHFKLERTRDDRRQPVRLPSGARTAFLVNWPTVRDQETVAVQKYRVRAGDSLLAIARRHGVTVDAIQEANSLRGTRILAGQTLEIPTRG